MAKDQCEISESVIRDEQRRLQSQYFTDEIELKRESFDSISRMSPVLGGILSGDETWNSVYTSEGYDLVDEFYWGKHNPAYCDRISNLCSQIPEAQYEKFANADLIVVIPARNERRLSHVINAIRTASRNRGGGNLRILPIVYHNHTEAWDDVPQDIQSELDSVVQRYGAIVVDEQVGIENKIQDAKKVALDIALMMKQERRIPIAMIDADVCKMTRGIFYTVLKDLRSEHPFRFVSTEYEFDPELMYKFPILHHYLRATVYLAKKLSFRIRQTHQDEVYSVKGGFLIADPISFMLAGGILPVHYVFEDVALTQQITLLARMFGICTPIVSLENTDHAVSVDPGREIAQLRRDPNSSPTVRWRNTVGIGASKYAQEVRENWEDLDYEGIESPLLASPEVCGDISDVMEVILCEGVRLESNRPELIEPEVIENYKALLMASVIYYFISEQLLDTGNIAAVLYRLNDRSEISRRLIVKALGIVLKESDQFGDAMVNSKAIEIVGIHDRLSKSTFTRIPE